jgi:hypothetical protein
MKKIDTPYSPSIKKWFEDARAWIPKWPISINSIESPRSCCVISLLRSVVWLDFFKVKRIRMRKVL